MTITVEVPDDVAQCLFLGGVDDAARGAIEAMAIEGYRSRRLGAAQIRRMLGFETRIEVDSFLKAHGVEADYGLTELERDRETFQRLRQG